MTHNTLNTNPSLEQRVQAAVDANPHLFISIHSNSSAYNTSAVGTEAYYFGAWSSPFAQYVSKNVANALDTQNRGAKFGYYYVTRNMQFPRFWLSADSVKQE
jgi:N-acetylmuramoyl-L-alanine amidase